MKTKDVVPHIIAFIVAVFLINNCFLWLITNWISESVIEHIEAIKVFIENYLLYIEGIVTIIIYCGIVASVRLIKRFKRGSIALSSGMFFFRPNTTVCSQKKTAEFLKKNSFNCELLQIVGATGWETFGNPDSPLHDTLKSCREVKIILTYPRCAEVLQRSKDLHMKADDYKKEIYDSIQYLDNLRKMSPRVNVQLKMYQGYPLWKYMVLQQSVWVWQYPRNKHVKNSPCYAFQRIITKKSIIKRMLWRQKTEIFTDDLTIYDHIYTHVTNIWKRDRLGTYDFNTKMLRTKNNRDETIEKPIF